jgi:hypothetical protein
VVELCCALVVMDVRGERWLDLCVVRWICDGQIKFNGDFDVDGQFDGVRSDFCCETLAGDGGIDSVYLFGCI